MRAGKTAECRFVTTPKRALGLARPSVIRSAVAAGGFSEIVSVRVVTMRAWVIRVLAVAITATFAGCATVYNLPGNGPLGEGVTGNDFGRESRGQEDDLLLALSFSGGGMRGGGMRGGGGGRCAAS